MGKHLILVTEKRLQMVATLPAAICKQLQLLPTYFDVIPYMDFVLVVNSTWLHDMLELMDTYNYLCLSCILCSRRFT